VIDDILLTAASLVAYQGSGRLSNATGFFFERDGRLYLVTSRHVLFDKASGHEPTRIEIELHVGEQGSANSVWFSIPLYHDGLSAWRSGRDSAGDVDIALIELDRAALPHDVLYRAFTPDNVPQDVESIEVGRSVLIVGFPLGFHDAFHHLPVVRQAVIASSFGLRFQGSGYFLTDARTHRGSSGAPVVMRALRGEGGTRTLPWALLGVHSARMDIADRDLVLDEVLGLNCAWYADILMMLSADVRARARS
jgi:S1-C subfamily serine protease